MRFVMRRPGCTVSEERLEGSGKVVAEYTYFALNLGL